MSFHNQLIQPFAEKFFHELHTRMSDAQTELKSSAASFFTGGSSQEAGGPGQMAPRHSIYSVSGNYVQFMACCLLHALSLLSWTPHTSPSLHTHYPSNSSSFPPRTCDVMLVCAYGKCSSTILCNIGNFSYIHCTHLCITCWAL